MPRLEDIISRVAFHLDDLGPESLPPDEALEVLRAAGMDFDRRLLERDIAMAIEPLRGPVEAGVPLRPDTVAQANTALGRVAKAHAASTAHAMVESYGLSALADAGGLGPDAPHLWVAVMDRGTCDSCAARHGEVQAWSEWQAEGPPRSDTLQCRQNCRCQLWPVDMAGQRVEVGRQIAGGQDTEVEVAFALEELFAALEAEGIRDARRQARGSAFDLEGILADVFREALR